MNLRVVIAAAACAAAVVFVRPRPVGSQSPRDRVAQRVRAALTAEGTARVIVRVGASFRAEGRLSADAAVAQRAAIRDRVQQVVGRLPGFAGSGVRRFQRIPYFAANVDAAALAQLEADADVISVEEDSLLRPTLMQSGPLVGALAAWAAGYTGFGWNVAVLDNGFDATHPFLAGKFASEACYSNGGGSGGGTSLCPGGVSSSTAFGSSVNCAFTGCDHGTHVAGIAVGAGASFSGIARDAGLIAVQVFTRFDSLTTCGGLAPCTLALESDEILGLERVAAVSSTYKIAAVNLSFGGTAYTDQPSCDAATTAVKAAVDNLRSIGIATIAAAGNDGRADALTQPACLSTAISVGSTTKSDQLSTFTNTSPFLSLLAPGSSINSSVPGGGFGVKSGTSMATPHVAGAWAILKQRRPTASVTQVLASLQSTGVGIVDGLSGRIFPRIQVNAAIGALVPAQLNIDIPVTGSVLRPPFRIAGWALDRASSASQGTGVDTVHVWAYPNSGAAPIFLGVAAYGGVRPDVGAAYGSRFAASAFDLVVQNLAPGTYRIVAYGHSVASGAFDGTGVIDVTMPAPVSIPQSFIDVPTGNATLSPSFLVSGWAIDLGAPAGTGVDAVHIWAYPLANPGAPIFLGVAAYGGVRSDLATYAGPQFANSGYTLGTVGVPPGAYRLVVYAHSTVSGIFSAQTRDITVRTLGNPAMNVDTPVVGSTMSLPFTIAGWAIDRDASSGPGVNFVQIWAYSLDGGVPVPVGVWDASYGGTRPDVAAVFGTGFAQSGFAVTVNTLAPGSYNLVVYAQSAVYNSFTNSRIVRVDVR